MHILRASWLLAACMGTIINASNILEVDLVFPRNETYAPAERFPVVFAFQNPERARYLNTDITYTIWNLDDRNDTLTRSHDLRWVNWSGSEPYLAHEFFSTFSNEGRWRVSWSLTWQSCDEDAFENHPFGANMIRNMSTWATWFTLQSSAPKVDLVAATANKTCPGEYGVVIDVTDKTMKVPSGVRWSGGDYTNDTCAVAAPTPTSTPDPCRVHIGKTTVASMEASLLARLCRGLNPPSDCPEDKKSAAQQLTVAGISCLLVTFGALGFFLG
jgi:hypothetical protein